MMEMAEARCPLSFLGVLLPSSSTKGCNNAKQQANQAQQEEI